MSGTLDAMDDLLISPGPGAPHGLRVPAAELIEQFSRSSGPGGQGVNTTDSRVQLRIDLTTTTALDDVQRARVLRNLAARLDGGVLTIAASEDRAQRRNRVAARRRLADLLRQAVAPTIARRATRPTKGSQRRRLDAKTRHGAIKANRRRPALDS